LLVNLGSGLLRARGYDGSVPRGVFVHNILDYTDDLVHCEGCGWVKRTDKGGRPMCSVARRMYKTSPGSTPRKRDKGKYPNRHARLRGAECAICGATTRLCTDHDHKCCPGTYGCEKCIRGTLCNSCNLGVSYIERAIDGGVLDKLLEYARR